MIASLLGGLALVGCPDPGAVDGGAEDAGVELDARPGRDSAVVLDGAVVPDLGVRLDASSGRDALPSDAELLAEDAGPAGTGESCATAFSWLTAGDDVLVATTSSAAHREQLSCSAGGPSATAPEHWWGFELTEPTRVVVRLGTLGWDGVLAARTGTCAPSAESCSDVPPTVELPSAAGAIFLGVEGFQTARGTYALHAELFPPYGPALNSPCANAEHIAELPAASSAHNYAASPLDAEACPLEGAVYWTFDSDGQSPVSLRVTPELGQDVDVAVLAGCDGAVIACGRAGGRGASEVLGPLSLPAGRWTLAVGSRVERPVPGSFSLSLGRAADCRRDADCPMGESCTALLSCGAGATWTVTSTETRTIPDGSGSIRVPLFVAGPPGRPVHVRARVAFDHPYPADLVVELIAPGEPEVRVRLRDRSDGPADVTYGADVPASGPGALADFMITPSAAGTWTLSVEDRAPGDRGALTGVALLVLTR